MKIVKIKLDAFKRLVSKYKECRRRYKLLQKEIQKYNKEFSSEQMEE